MLSAFTAYFIIPGYTLLFVSGTNWLTLNLSVIGSSPEKQFSFLLLGIIVGFYYHTILERLLSLLPSHRLEGFILHTALILLLCAVIIPYLPETIPFWAFLHTVFAMTSSLLLLICLYLTIWKLSGLSGAYWRKLHPFRILLILITLFCGILLAIAGLIISTALEVFFLIATTILVQQIYVRFRRFLPAKARGRSRNHR